MPFEPSALLQSIAALTSLRRPRCFIDATAGILTIPGPRRKATGAVVRRRLSLGWCSRAPERRDDAMGRPKETFGESTAASINPSIPFSRIASAEAFEMGSLDPLRNGPNVRRTGAVDVRSAGRLHVLWSWRHERPTEVSRSVDRFVRSLSRDAGGRADRSRVGAPSEAPSLLYRGTEEAAHTRMTTTSPLGFWSFRRNQLGRS